MTKALLLTLLAMIVLSTFYSKALAVCDIFEGHNGKYCVHHGWLYSIGKRHRHRIPIYIPDDFPEYFNIELFQTPDKIEVFGLLYERTNQPNVNRYIGVLKLFREDTVVIPLPTTIIGKLIRFDIHSEINGSKIEQIIRFTGSKDEFRTQYFL